jgi:predicted GIY-YIG superfamily endonuclease
MHFVYIIQSEITGLYYYGFTARTVSERLADHNAGKSLHTKKARPWKLIWYAGFSTKQKAEAFEDYLKSGSGHAFSRKRLI